MQTRATVIRLQRIAEQEALQAIAPYSEVYKKRRCVVCGAFIGTPINYKPVDSIFGVERPDNLSNMHGGACVTHKLCMALGEHSGTDFGIRARLLSNRLSRVINFITSKAMTAEHIDKQQRIKLALDTANPLWNDVFRRDDHHLRIYASDYSKLALLNERKSVVNKKFMVVRTSEGLRNILFSTLESYLSDEIDAERARTIVRVSDALMKSVAVDLEHTKVSIALETLAMRSGTDRQLKLNTVMGSGELQLSNDEATTNDD
jgi:hypothetical protein